MTSSPPPVKVVTDSTSDIPADVARELGITVIPLAVQIGGRSYHDKVDLSGEAFYRLLQDTPGLPLTSQPPIGEVEAVYRDLTADGSSVVSIHVSSGLSGTYNACAAAATSSDLRPGAVRVIDSLAVSMSLGWIGIFAARAACGGAGQDAVAALAERLVPRTRILALLDTLEWLQRGGRIGPASAFLGTMLAIKPILHLKDGRVAPLERVRSKAKGLQRLVEITRAFGPLDALAVAHGDSPEEAAALVDALDSVYPREQILLSHVGPALGSHVGPRAVGICCVLAAPRAAAA
jgi:DegV family protein with EDD domain